MRVFLLLVFYSPHSPLVCTCALSRAARGRESLPRRPSGHHICTHCKIIKLMIWYRTGIGCLSVPSTVYRTVLHYLKNNLSEPSPVPFDVRVSNKSLNLPSYRKGRKKENNLKRLKGPADSCTAYYRQKALGIVNTKMH
jgi:hypothetical protein